MQGKQPMNLEEHIHEQTELNIIRNSSIIVTITVLYLTF